MYLRNIKAIGALIRDRRTALGLSQTAFAKQIGVRQAWVSKTENGKVAPDLDLVLRALNALGVTLWADIGDGAPLPNDQSAADPDAPNMAQLIDDMLNEL